MEGSKTDKEEDCSRRKGRRQIKRKTVPGGRVKGRQRGRLFQAEGSETDKEEDCSRWKGRRQVKRKTVQGGKAKDRGQRKGKTIPGERAKDRERGRLLQIERSDRSGTLFPLKGAERTKYRKSARANNGVWRVRLENLRVSEPNGQKKSS